MGEVRQKIMPDEVIAVETAFDVIDESDDWIIVNKPAPLVVHPTNGKSEPTLLGGLDALLMYDLANGARLGLINRLDRETSGVVVVAKRKSAARMLSRAIERREVQKVYRAIVFGWPDWDELEIDQPILRQGQIAPSAVWVKQCVHPDGRDCQTRVKVLRRLICKGRQVAELEVSPRTGRMHQIRVHLAWAGYPIIGDKLYGVAEGWYLTFMETGWLQEMEESLLMKRQALHATQMDFTELDLMWTAPLAADMRAFLDAGKDESMLE